MNCLIYLIDKHNMGFTFGFTEDIPDEDAGGKLQGNEEPADFVNPIDNVSEAQKPKLYTLHDLLKLSFTESRITYEPVQIYPEMTLYRRELFDVRHQLMMEDSTFDKKEGGSSAEEFNILIGETGEDLRNGVYEGGLKSWECSFDIIAKLKDLQIVEKLLQNNRSFNVIELGCGTSLPTLYILQLIFSAKASHNQPISIILSDFNYDVLRLVTLPNILINWCFSVLSAEELHSLQQRQGIDGNIREGEIDITEAILVRFESWMQENQLTVSFISGSWCRTFMEIVHDTLPSLRNETNIVLTSETIYSPAILPVVSEIMVELSAAEEAARADSVTLLAAKDIYFGVGGSIVECRQYLETRGARVETTSIAGNFKRSVLSISL